MLVKATCKICGETFEYERKGAPRTLCDKPECRLKNESLRSLAYYNKHKEQMKAKRKQYQIDHKEELKAKRKLKYKENYSTYRKEYNKNNKSISLVEKHISPPPNTSLKEVAKMAMDAHLSYGEYVNRTRI